MSNDHSLGKRSFSNKNNYNDGAPSNFNRRRDTKGGHGGKKENSLTRPPHSPTSMNDYCTIRHRNNAVSAPAAPTSVKIPLVPP